MSTTSTSRLLTDRPKRLRAVVTKTTPEVRHLYRSARTVGISRHDANLLAMGAAMATRQGAFRFQPDPTCETQP